MPDNKSWLQLFAGKHELSAVITQEGSIKAGKEIKIGNPKGTYSGYDLMPTHLLGVTQTRCVLATPDQADGYSNPNVARHINFFEFSVDDINPKVRQYTIDLPKAENGYEGNVALAPGEEVELSPRRNRLAWLLHRQVASPTTGWFSRWLPSFYTTPRYYTELRITDLVGNSGKILGWIEFKKNDKMGYSQRPFQMHWLPDGQHLSFIFNGSLHVVPTD